MKEGFYMDGNSSPEGQQGTPQKHEANSHSAKQPELPPHPVANPSQAESAADREAAIQQTRNNIERMNAASPAPVPEADQLENLTPAATGPAADQPEGPPPLSVTPVGGPGLPGFPAVPVTAEAPADQAAAARQAAERFGRLRRFPWGGATLVALALAAWAQFETIHLFTRLRPKGGR